MENVRERSFTMEDLTTRTERWREHFSQGDVMYVPDVTDQHIPQSVFKYKPVTWFEDDLYFTLFGDFPYDGITALGRTPIESMIEFDKELKARLSEDGKHLNPISDEERDLVHKDVYPFL